MDMEIWVGCTCEACEKTKDRLVCIEKTYGYVSLCEDCLEKALKFIKGD